MTHASMTRRLLGQLVGGLVFAALACAALSLHFTRMARPSVQTHDADAAPMPREAVLRALAPEAVCRAFEDISALGSRAPGQPGLDKTRDYLIARFRAMGLETFTQDVDIPYPLLADGSGLRKPVSSFTRMETLSA